MAYNLTFAQLKEISQEEALEEVLNHYNETNMYTYVYSLLKNNFKCKDIKNNMWFFKDKDNEWSWDKDNRQVRIALRDVVQAELMKNIHTNTAYMQTMEATDNEYETLRNKTTRLAYIATVLDKEKNKNDIIKYCRDIFYEEN